MDCYDELGNRYQLPVYVLSAPINLLREGSGELDPALDEIAPPAGPGVDVPIKLHLSTGRDIRLTVCSTDTISLVKRQVQTLAGVDARRLRIYFAGKQLTDRQRIDEVKIHRGYTLQVVVTEQMGTPSAVPVIATMKVTPIALTVSTASETESVPANSTVLEKCVPSVVQEQQSLELSV